MEESSRASTTKSGLIEQTLNSRYSLWVREALDALSDNFTITDPSIPGHPIVFASRGFLKMTGYSREEVIGKNGRVFQGPRTNRRSVMEIREAIREERPVQVNLLNYKKTGTPFWMFFHMNPVFGKDDGRVIHFVAVQVPIMGPKKHGSGTSDDWSGSTEVVYGSCRRDVCSGSLPNSRRISRLDSDSTESEIEESCEASEFEKRRAAAAMHSILSVLTQYSEFTGDFVCGKRCCAPGAHYLSSSLKISLGRIKQSFVLTDPCLPDMPIVYASNAFLKLTGYDANEVLGRNCRFLSGLGTDPATLYQMKESIRLEQSCTIRILNYRKDKSTFWNLLHISPVRNAMGKIAYFVGVQVEERGKNEGTERLSPERRQLSVVGAVKVAVRSASMLPAPPKS